MRPATPSELSFRYFIVTGDHPAIHQLRNVLQERVLVWARWKEFMAEAGADHLCISTLGEVVGLQFNALPNRQNWKFRKGGFQPKRNSKKGKELGSMPSVLSLLDTFGLQRGPVVFTTYGAFHNLVNYRPMSASVLPDTIFIRIPWRDIPDVERKWCGGKEIKHLCWKPVDGMRELSEEEFFRDFRVGG